MHQVPVYVEQAGAVAVVLDDMLLPQLVVERFRGHGGVDYTANGGAPGPAPALLYDLQRERRKPSVKIE